MPDTTVLVCRVAQAPPRTSGFHSAMPIEQPPSPWAMPQEDIDKLPHPPASWALVPRVRPASTMYPRVPYFGRAVTDALPFATLVAHGAPQPPLTAPRVTGAVTFAALVREGDWRAAGGTLWAPAPAAPTAAARKVDKRQSFAAVTAASVAYGRDFPTGRLGARRLSLCALRVALSVRWPAARVGGCLGRSTL